jgi:hypothetical protein
MSADLAEALAMLLWNAAYIVAVIVVVTGLVASILGTGTWHRRPWFHLLALTIVATGGIYSLLDGAWIRFAIAIVGVAFFSWELRRALAREKPVTIDLMLDTERFEAAMRQAAASARKGRR